MAKQSGLVSGSFSLGMFVILIATGVALVFSAEARAYPSALQKTHPHNIEPVQYYDHRNYWCEIVRRRVWDPYIGRWVIMEREVCHRRRPHHY